MLYKLTGLTELLRRAGLRISPGETEDLFKAVLLAGLDRDNLEAAVLATLAKGEREKRVAQKFFKLYFSSPAGDSCMRKKCDPAVVLAQPPRLEDSEFLARLDEMRASIRKERGRCKMLESRSTAGGGPVGRGGGGKAVPPPPAGRLLQAVLAGNPEEMKALAGEAVRSVLEKTDSGTDDFHELLRQMKVSLNWAEETEHLEKECQRQSGLPLHRENIFMFESILSDELDRELWRRRPGTVFDAAGRANLAEIDFGKLSLDQVEDIKKVVVKIGRSLATRSSYRRARSRKGEVDLRRTVRSAARTGGAPVVLYRRARQPYRPDLVVLCDLSGSVSRFTGFMLQLIYVIQERFRTVHTFAFVDDVQEITEFLKRQDSAGAVVDVLRGAARIARTPFSDYGAVWKGFCERHIHCVNDKTTVLVLGDARSNWRPPGLEYLAQIREKASRIVWLNPAPRKSWDREDSIISQYSPYCSRLFECRNLRQLGEVARYIGRL